MASGMVNPMPTAPKTTTASKPAQTTRPATESYKPAQTTRPVAESFKPSPATRTPIVVNQPVVKTTPTKTATPKPAVVPTVDPTVDPVVVPTVTTTQRPSTRTPVYGANGKLIGYNVTNYNLDGSIDSVTFEASAAEEEVVGTTNIQVLKSMLIATGLSSALVEGSTTFLQSLLKDGLSEESAVDIYLNNKEFTTKTGSVLTSPFYTAYGFYNEGLTAKLSAGDLFNTVEGYKSTQTKYSLSDKFASQEYIQKYLKNNISVATLDKNANKARLAAVTADPLVISNLQQLGYIGSNADLTDFYLDPNVGMEKMQQNFNTAALSFEAVRRANTGITFNKANFEKLGADLTAKGYDETQAQYVAGQAYNVIGQTLKPAVSLSNIYEGNAAADAATIQSELEQEQLNSIESLRRKKLIELETRSFQAETGIAPTGLNTNYLRKTSNAGQF